MLGLLYRLNERDSEWENVIPPELVSPPHPSLPALPSLPLHAIAYSHREFLPQANTQHVAHANTQRTQCEVWCVESCVLSCGTVCSSGGTVLWTSVSSGWRCWGNRSTSGSSVLSPKTRYVGYVHTLLSLTMHRRIEGAMHFVRVIFKALGLQNSCHQVVDISEICPLPKIVTVVKLFSPAVLTVDSADSVRPIDCLYN